MYTEYECYYLINLFIIILIIIGNYYWTICDKHIYMKRKNVGRIYIQYNI